MATRPAAPAPAPKPVLPSAGREVDDENDDEDEELDLSNGTDTGMLMPASVARGKLKAAKQDEGLDLFGLGESGLLTCTLHPSSALYSSSVHLWRGERS